MVNLFDAFIIYNKANKQIEGLESKVVQCKYASHAEAGAQSFKMSSA